MAPKQNIAIFGAGITGLAAGRELAMQGHQVDIYEAESKVGGLAATWNSDDGFIYDNGPHFIFSTLAEKIGIKDECFPVKYYENLQIKNSVYRFPFGFARNPLYCASIGTAMLSRFLKPKPKHLKGFLQTYYGRLFSQAVLLPLIEKWAGIPGNEISIDFASRLLPTNLSYILYSVVKKIRGGITEDYYKEGRYIVYPQGTIKTIFDHLQNTPNMKLHLNSPVTRIMVQGDQITNAWIQDQSISADYYINTTPISLFSEMVEGSQALSNWKDFSYRGISILFIKINRPKILDVLWTWFPEPHYSFYRISEFKNALPQMAPKDQTLISVEFAHDAQAPIATMSPSEIYRMIREDLQRLYGLKEEEILGFDQKRSPYAYPVLKTSTEKTQRALTHRTPLTNLFIAGRIGMFQYRMMEGSFDSGLDCAKTILSMIEGKEETQDPSSKVQRDAYGRPDTLPD